MKSDDKAQSDDNRLMCPHKGSFQSSRCWEQECALWDHKCRQCSELSRNLAKADEVEAARTAGYVADCATERTGISGY